MTGDCREEVASELSIEGRVGFGKTDDSYSRGKEHGTKLLREGVWGGLTELTNAAFYLKVAR